MTEHTAVEAILRDGTSVSIRGVGPDDRDGLIALFGRMSPSSIRHRFFCAKRELTEVDLRYLMGSPTDVALVATVRRGSGETILGVGRYVVLVGPRPVAEVAFDVGDADQGRGIGTLLLDHLARIARDRGIETFRAVVEADNSQMLEVFARSGFAVSESLQDRIYHVDIPVADTERFLVAAAARERVAAARSLRAVFAPASVAVIGASRTQGTIGRTILDNLIKDGFRGPIYPVNPRAPDP